MDAARVLDVLAQVRAHGVTVWLDGGWAIDALLGEQTRPHDDLDLVARLDDSEQIEHALGELGYLLAGGAPPTSFELVDDDGHQVDVHPASISPTGDGVYRMEDGRDWIFPAAGFRGVGSVLGSRVPSLTPEVVMVNHTTGYALDEEHQRDVRALGAHYGIPVPEFESRSPSDTDRSRPCGREDSNLQGPKPNGT
jgi:lincosamide nucleotidyltransferase A/C/D/E